eukprot:TRINITY_DN1205_c0_g1_i1.p1 TRINITY_DN1205_c0_g1~~TRINITY_DN1205_c0_g1_i1.p1  ORF type:complete len:215 (-),score=31.37 TRINITY_DN1205_c0_g1_i1:434-1078(-)
MRKVMLLMNCHLCGRTGHVTGMDRVDNDFREYIPSNVLPACEDCNLFRHTQSIRACIDLATLITLQQEAGPATFKVHQLAQAVNQSCGPVATTAARIGGPLPIKAGRDTALKSANAYARYVQALYEHLGRKRPDDFVYLKEPEYSRFRYAHACSYCKRERISGHLSIDRIDSLLAYIPGNVVASCAECNFAKSDHTVEKFYEVAQRVSMHAYNR